MFEAGKFEVLIPVGIPGEGMLGSRFIPPVASGVTNVSDFFLPRLGSE